MQKDTEADGLIEKEVEVANDSNIYEAAETDDDEDEESLSENCDESASINEMIVKDSKVKGRFLFLWQIKLISDN